jgi:periplasmic copper chaperone A
MFRCLRSHTVGRRIAVLAVAVAGCLGVAMLPAAAHVTVNPREAPKGGFTKLAFRVPNERDDAGTTRLEVVFPADHPIPFVSVKPHPGWTATPTKTKLAKPVTSADGDKTTEAVSKIVWEGGTIKPGEFDEFEVSVGPLPEDVDSLTFKALQTYANGEVVRWIDEPGPDGAEPEHPAPVLKLTAAGGDEHAAAGKDAAGTTGSTVATVSAGGEVEPLAGVASQKDLDSAKRLTAVALVLGLAALGMGVIALMAVRVKKQPDSLPPMP